MITFGVLERIEEETAVAYFKVLSRYSPGSTEANLLLTVHWPTTASSDIHSQSPTTIALAAKVDGQSLSL
jgi:hypothetical protein